MKIIAGRIIASLTVLYLWLPSIVRAGGEAAGEIVVVADTRVLNSGILKYFSDLYNTNILLFALWAVVLTAVYGCFLGVLMDMIMSRTGLDLKSRKIIEH
ncbi:MAG: DVU0150 family protein [Pseudomonadota bacterium]